MKSNFQLIVTLTACILLAVTKSTASAQQVLTVEQILTKWEERQKQVVSARFFCDEEMTRPKGATSYVLKLADSLPKPDAVYPPQDHTYSKPLYLSFDGDKMRLDYEQLDWRETVDELHHIFTFDGKTGKIIHKRNGTFPQGSIRSENHNRHVGNFHVRAILMMFRSQHPKLSPGFGAKYQLTGKRGVIGGKECVEITTTPPNQASTFIWVDPSRGFTPVRHILRSKSVDLARLDVEYGEHPEVGWVPSSWSLVLRYPNGSVSESARARVTRFELNIAIRDSEFDPDFPVGTYVVDNKDRQDFIQKENGNKRFVRGSEISRPYEELINSPGITWFDRLAQWPVIVGAIALLFSGTAIVIWWKKTKKLPAE